MAFASDASLVVTRPPSPATRSLVGESEKTSASPKLPMGLPRYWLPKAWAPSKISFRLCFWAILRERFDVGRISVKVDDEQSACALGDLAFDVGDVNVPGVRIAIGENWGQAVPARRVARGEEGEAGDDDFAGDAEAAQRHHQAAGAARNRDAMLDLQAFRDGCFEFSNDIGVGDQAIFVGRLVMSYDAFEGR